MFGKMILKKKPDKLNKKMGFKMGIWGGGGRQPFRKHFDGAGENKNF